MCNAFFRGKRVYVALGFYQSNPHQSHTSQSSASTFYEISSIITLCHFPLAHEVNSTAVGYRCTRRAELVFEHKDSPEPCLRKLNEKDREKGLDMIAVSVNDRLGRLRSSLNVHDSLFPPMTPCSPLMLLTIIMTDPKRVGVEKSTSLSPLQRSVKSSVV